MLVKECFPQQWLHYKCITSREEPNQDWVIFTIDEKKILIFTFVQVFVSHVILKLIKSNIYYI